MARKKEKKFITPIVSSLLALSLTTAPISFAAEEDATLNLRIMETTDIHVNVLNYDYYKDEATDEYGLVKTATLIKQARAEVNNSMLFDNGDLIQGNPMGDYVAKVDTLEQGEIHPVYKAMNELGYDAGNIGNHEFNYGLEFLERALEGANFPYVSANVFNDDGDNDPTNDVHRYDPYIILERTFQDSHGKDVILNVGVIGFVPPQIMTWDKSNLEGQVIAKSMIETAEMYIPKMKEEGADIIVAIPHSGISSISGNTENAVADLSKIEGIDAILFGHSHRLFPSEEYSDVEGVNIEKGTINGVASVMPGYWGNHLGIIDLKLEEVDGEWVVVDSQSTNLAIYDRNEGSLVDADQDIIDALKDDHEHTLTYIRGPVGTTTAPINSFFALIQDDPSVQIVNNAQRWYAEKYIQGTEYDGMPVLSAAAPFKSGYRDPNNYTDMEAGTIAVKNVADLYVYPNTFKAVMLTGAEVKEWLEMSAGQFNQIDVNTTAPQHIKNEKFPTYNFDVIDGVTYEIDITQPAKYDNSTGEIINEGANRIVNLQYDGKPIDLEQSFIVATNNYRAFGGGSFPNLGSEDKVVIDSPDENRQIIINYIIENETINPSADGNWTFASIEEDVTVTFETSAKSESFAAEYDLETFESEDMIPVRATSDSLGVEVKWDEPTMKVTLQKDDQMLEYVLYEKMAMLNGEEIEIETEIRDQHLYIRNNVYSDIFGGTGYTTYKVPLQK
ncbi:bifunctional 2',3'-cyclic-nucleotide 2'-phosphodiesterase/3'-nucleotidase [Longirhabdus pacifica]|uniref:bifunctional 2',3'-cyclic-nucleotide 2'-phosphodiesterase/3'-nucleotidase n=1 Tax=Longirhabdus pacifica TaxID=2305227 RepID=UPI001008C6E1|nr:bifunctional 2',3'-cyclic-nucleotide 2'-phosphodiesterase/3'-nucleotidase [Longirhabdus pacifica]